MVNVHKISDKENNRRLEMYAKGMSVPELAETLPLGSRGVRTWLSTRGLKPHPIPDRYKTKSTIIMDKTWFTMIPQYEKDIVRKFVSALILYYNKYMDVTGKKPKERQINRFMNVYVQMFGGERNDKRWQS